MKNLICLLLIIFTVSSCSEIRKPTIKFPDSKKSAVVAQLLPKGQVFTVSAIQDTLLIGEKGTLIIIPANAFKNQDDQTVNGQIDIEILEILTIEDIISADLHTISKDKLLESGGMFYINVKQNGQQLQLVDGMELYIELATAIKKEGMQVFGGGYGDSGNIVWSLSAEQEKYLISVPLSELDFSAKKRTKA